MFKNVATEQFWWDQIWTQRYRTEIESCSSNTHAFDVFFSSFSLFCCIDEVYDVLALRPCILIYVVKKRLFATLDWKKFQLTKMTKNKKNALVFAD